MNEKQIAFVDAYMILKNATEAAKKAGYSDRSAYSQGQRLMKNDEIKQAIAKRQAKLSKSAMLTVESHLDMLEQLRNEARERGQIAAAIRAEEDRGKVCGLYEERVRAELSGPSGGAMEVKHTVELVRSEDGRPAK